MDYGLKTRIVARVTAVLAVGLSSLVLADLAVAEGEQACSGIFCRQEIEGADGLVVKLLRILEVPSVRTATTNTTRYETFWAAGPSATDLQTWHDAECDTCAPPAGFDEVDGTVDRLQEFVDLSKSLKAQPIDDVAKSWQSWLTLLIDTAPGRTDDFDDTLKAIAQGASTETPPVKGIPGWRSELIDIRDKKLPLCAITSPESDNVTIDNSPCTINQARKEEFNREFANTRAFLAKITNPQSQFYRDLITTRILPNLTPGRLAVHVPVRNLVATLGTVKLVNNVLRYSFTYTFDYFNDCGAGCPTPTWIQASNRGDGAVTITTLELGGSSAKNGLITYDFVYSLTYSVPKPVPVFTYDYCPPLSTCPSCVLGSTCTSSVLTWESSWLGTVGVTPPSLFSCDYALGSCSGSVSCQGYDVCTHVGPCTYPTAQAGTLDVPRYQTPSAQAFCPTGGTPWDVVRDPGPPEKCLRGSCPAAYLRTDASCAAVGSAGTPPGGWQSVSTGTYRIDDDNPTGTGLTISPPRTVNAPVTVQSFRDGVDAFDAFVNRIQRNATCPPGEICFGSSDADTEEEFLPVLDALAAFVPEIETFRTAAQTFSTNMWTKYGQFGGINPVAYRWKDSAGNHSVETKVSDFHLAQTKKKKKGNFLVGKVCLKLEDYTDDGTNTWVTITQQDPSAAIGGTSTLWTWNPFSKPINQKACASYSYDRVGLAKCP